MYRCGSGSIVSSGKRTQAAVTATASPIAGFEAANRQGIGNWGEPEIDVDQAVQRLPDRPGHSRVRSRFALDLPVLIGSDGEFQLAVVRSRRRSASRSRPLGSTSQWRVQPRSAPGPAPWRPPPGRCHAAANLPALAPTRTIRSRASRCAARARCALGYSALPPVPGRSSSLRRSLQTVTFTCPSSTATG